MSLHSEHVAGSTDKEKKDTKAQPELIVRLLPFLLRLSLSLSLSPPEPSAMSGST